jgi:hypothetical protein
MSNVDMSCYDYDYDLKFSNKILRSEHVWRIKIENS